MNQAISYMYFWCHLGFEQRDQICIKRFIKELNFVLKYTCLIQSHCFLLLLFSIVGGELSYTECFTCYFYVEGNSSSCMIKFINHVKVAYFSCFC